MRLSNTAQALALITPWRKGQICKHQESRTNRDPSFWDDCENVCEYTTGPRVSAQEIRNVCCQNPMCTLPCPLSSGSKHVQLQENSFVPLGATQSFVCIVSSFGRIYRNPKTLAACDCSGTVLSAKQADMNYDWNGQRVWQHELQV